MSDFDDTIFKRNHGLIQPAVDYLEGRGLPIYIVTYRAHNQKDFILETVSQTNLNLIGIGFAGSRNKDPETKFQIYSWIAREHNIVEALDDDSAVVLGLRNRGYAARHP